MSGGAPLAFDPHVHTDASHDCSTPVEAVLRAADEAGLDAVAITDHDTVEGAVRARELAADRELTVVPGVEVSTGAGHLLALGVETAPPPGRPLPDTVARVRELGGVAVIPHPFQLTRHGVGRRHLGEPDALETLNAMAVTGLQNLRARAAARKRGLPGIGASDAHAARQVGRAYTAVEVDGPATVDRLLDAVREGAVGAAGDTAPGRWYVGKLLRSAGARTAALSPLSSRTDG